MQSVRGSDISTSYGGITITFGITACHRSSSQNEPILILSKRSNQCYGNWKNLKREESLPGQ